MSIDFGENLSGSASFQPAQAGFVWFVAAILIARNLSSFQNFSDPISIPEPGLLKSLG